MGFFSDLCMQVDSYGPNSSGPCLSHHVHHATRLSEASHGPTPPQVQPDAGLGFSSLVAPAVAVSEPSVFPSSSFSDVAVVVYSHDTLGQPTLPLSPGGKVVRHPAEPSLAGEVPDDPQFYECYEEDPDFWFDLDEHIFGTRGDVSPPVVETITHLGFVPGLPASSTGGGPVQLVDPTTGPLAARIAAQSSSSSALQSTVDGHPAKRYRITKKTKDDQTPSGSPISLLGEPGPSNVGTISPLPRPTMGVSVGKRTLVINPALGSFSRMIHPTHPLGHKRGVVWCWKCGAFAVRDPQKLGDPCMPISFSGPAIKSEAYGRACLSRVRRGLTPRSDMQWPDQREQPLDAPPDLAIIFAPPSTVINATTVSQSPKAPEKRARGRADAS